MAGSKISELIDLYAEPINFQYQKRNLYKTFYGGCVSLVLFIGLFGYLGWLLLSMVQRELPSIIKIQNSRDIPFPITILKDPTYTTQNSTREELSVKERKEKAFWAASIGFRLNTGTTLNLIDLDKKYFNMEFQQAQVKNSKIKYTSLEYKKCLKFGTFSQKEYDSLSLNMTYCLNDNFILQGIQGEEDSQWVEIRVAMCNGLTTCKNETEITNFMYNLQIEIYYQQQMLNTTALGEELSDQSIIQYYWDVVPNLTKRTHIELGTDAIYSYEGYFPDFLQKSFIEAYILVLAKFKVYLSDLNERKDVMIISLLPSRNYIVYERRYVDVLFQLSMVGGISSVVFLIGYLFVSSCHNFRLNESLMNDFYNIISSENTKAVEIKFDEFIRNWYNKLILKYLKKNSQFKSLKTLKSENEMKTIANVVKTKNNFNNENNNKIDIDKNYKNKINNNNDENDSFFDQINLTSQKKITQQVYIDEIFKVHDDEGLINHFGDELNALERYFTMRRIESIFGVDKSERDELLLTIENFDKNQEDLDFYEKLFTNKTKSYLYNIERAVYDSFIYTCNDKMNFSSWKVLVKVLCCCCFRRNNRPSVIKDSDKIKEDSHLKKNFEIFDTSVQKLGLDFDLISVLKSVEDFEKFKGVLFCEAQNGLFESVANPVIKVSDLNEQEEKEMNELEMDQNNLDGFRTILMGIMDKGNVSVIDKNMLKNMGISLEDIKKFANLAKSKIDEGNLNEIKKENILKNINVNNDLGSNYLSGESDNSVSNDINKLTEEEPILSSQEKKSNEDKEIMQLPNDNDNDFFRQINEQFKN